MEKRGRDICFSALETHAGAHKFTPPGGGTIGISGWGCAAGTLETLAYTRDSSAEFCYPLLE